MGTETDRVAELLADAAWKLRHGYAPGGSTVTGSVANLCDAAARAIDPTVRTHYEGRYPAATGHGPVDDVDINEMTFEERRALPARYHRPYYMDLGTPSVWTCTACWDAEEAIAYSWPCEVAQRDGRDVARALGLEHSH
jgi:hypothetical protein